MNGLTTDPYLWHKDAKRYYIRDPIDGGRVLRNDSRDRIFAWCEEHCKDDFYSYHSIWYFKDEQDYLLFMLRWPK